MKRLINATTILSLALYIVPPFAAQAQDLQKVMVGDQAVFCLPNKAAVCPAGDMCVVAKKAENCQANAEKEVAKKAADAAAAAGTTAPAPATDQAAADKAAADKAAADKAAAGQAAAAQAAAAQAAADKAAADKAAAQAATDKAAADKAAAAQAAATQAAADKQAADKVAAEQAAAGKKAAKKAAAEQAAAKKAAAEQAAAEKAAADQAAAAKAAADKATADKAAADQAAAAKAAADQAAVAKAAADQAAAAKAAADKAAADKAAVAQSATDKATADKAAAGKAATDQAAADKAAADKAAADKAAASKAATDQAAADKAAADKAAADKAAATQPATTTPTPAPAPAPANPDGLKSVTVNGTEVFCLPTKAAACPQGAQCVVAIKPGNCKANAEKKLAGLPTPLPPATDPNAVPQQTPKQIAAAKAAAAKAAADQAALDAANIAAAQKAQAAAAAAAANDPNLKPVAAPVPDQKAVETLNAVLVAPPAGATAAAAPVVVAVEAGAKSKGKGLKAPKADDPAPKDAVVTTETVTADSIRTSSQNFGAAPVVVAPGKKTGLSDLEKVGLVALGALVIGAIIDGNRQVVQNTGDRVVVRQPNGSYYVYKDDDALLREPGVRLTRETYRDGSSRTVIIRANGTKTVTVRDASGRVLRRVIYHLDDRPFVLFDDLRPEPVIIIAHLPRPQPQLNIIYLDGDDAAAQATLASANAAALGQKFSLLQIRTIPQVRYLAPVIHVNQITFATGSAAIDPTEAQLLNSLGQFITQMIARNPSAVFLIGGHTDAVGSAADNLTLSDQRAESVAKALIENFQVPAENLVVQGYGESDLAVNTLGAEPANRRVDVRIITDLLDQTIN